VLNPNRSSISISLHRDDRMDAALLTAVRERPGDPDARNALGNHLLAQGQPQSATQCCQEAIALEPRFAEAHFNLGNAARVQGDSREAEAAFRRARKDRLYRDTGFMTALEDFYASLVSGDQLEPRREPS
jgi:Flp pilus assembly protein TadD